jgi:hypothetical protein
MMFSIDGEMAPKGFSIRTMLLKEVDDSVESKAQPRVVEHQINEQAAEYA